jgi:hypothetical protein
MLCDLFFFNALWYILNVSGGAYELTNFDY